MTQQDSNGSQKNVTTKVYKAPWGWVTEVYDPAGKQIFSGAMYASEQIAQQAIEHFLASHNASKI